MSGDRGLNGLKLVSSVGTITEIQQSRLNGNGEWLLLSVGTIISTGSGVNKLYDGYISGKSGSLNLTSINSPSGKLELCGTITDNSQKTEINISSIGTFGTIEFSGLVNNNFTGNVNITGRQTLRLNKVAAISIPTNLIINAEGRAETLHSGQLSRTSRILLRSGKASSSTFGFSGIRDRDIKEVIQQLSVEGTGKLDFGGDLNHGSRYLYLDNLEITNGSRLIIQNWKGGRDYLLVRKDSSFLLDALKKIEFQGGRREVELVDFDRYYYSISNTPEPAVYGAGLALTGLGVLGLRRKSRLKLRP